MRPTEFSCDGTAYDLSHTFPRIFNAITLGRPDGVPVKVVLSCHCFTLKVSADSGDAPDYQFEDEQRWFCPHRYEDSKSIHTHFQYALERATTFNVNWTSDANGNVNYLTVDSPQEGYRYCMYFDVDISKNNTASEVFIIVRSAYKQHIKFKTRDRIRLGTLIDERLGIRNLGKKKKRRKK